MLPKIDTNERRLNRILIITPLFAFIIFGYVLSQIAGNVLFVKRIGADFLPYTFIVNAVLGILTSLTIASILPKISVARLIRITSAIGAVIFAAAFWLIKNNIQFGYGSYLIISQVIYMLLGSVLMWQLGLAVCTPFEAKRSFGYFSFGASGGGIIAGILSSALSAKYSTEWLIPITIVSLICVILNTFIIQHYYNDLLKPSDENDHASHLETLKQGITFYKRNRVAKMLSAILILFFSARWIGEYEFQKILGDTFDESQFSKITGIISIIENACLMVIFLFMQQWILKKAGVLNTLLISPFPVLAPFIILLFFPVYLVAAALKLLIKLINYSTLSSSVRLAFTAIPHAVRGGVSAFINGMAESGGMLLAGAGLAVLTKFLPDKTVIGIGIALIALIIFIAIKLRKAYVGQIVSNLQSTDINDVHTAIEDLAEPAYRKVGVQELMKIIRHKTEAATMRKIVFALGKIDNASVIPSLLEIFDRYDITVKYAVIEAIHGFSSLNKRLKDLPFTKFNLMESYQKIFLREEDAELKILILEHLSDFDPDNAIAFLKDAAEKGKDEVQYRAIKAMKYFHDRGIIRYIEPFLNDTRLMIRASAIIALWQFDELRLLLMKHFIKIMSKNDKESILASLFIIEKLGITWERQFAERHLENSDPEIKTMAALTLLTIERPKNIEIIVENLINKTPFSSVVARNIKGLSDKAKKALLNMVKNKGHRAIQICADNLRATHLNFSDETEWLTQTKAGQLAFTSQSQ